MHLNNPLAEASQILSPAELLALQTAVANAGSQSKVAIELGVSAAVISTLLKNKYTGNVATMAQRIRGKYLLETVTCPVYGTLSGHSCLEFQARPVAFTNPLRAALGRACKTCPNRKEAA